MIGVGAFCHRLLILVGVAVVWFSPMPALAECMAGNVLARAEIAAHPGVIDPELLTDGWGTPDGSKSGAREIVTMTSADAEITWDIGEVMAITAMDIQADYDDVYVVLGSRDGTNWGTLWQTSKVTKRGLHSRSIRDLDEEARFIRLRVRGGDSNYAVSEFRVFCETPSPWPPSRHVGLTPKEKSESTATFQAFSWKIVLALFGLFLVFVVVPRVPTRFRHHILYLVIGLSAVGWTNFGQFQGKDVIHKWDMFHYYTGSKYYDEVGYFDLYRCLAESDRQRGYEDNYRGLLIRDLDDNTIYPYSWSKTEEGRCRANFSKERWQEFGRDLENFRQIMESRPLEHVVGDHGFNATPFHATFLNVITRWTSPSRGTLRVLAQADTITLFLGIMALAWGFGLRVATVAALVLQVGAPWSYHWVGGGLGRHVWFALSCLGLALLKKDYPGRGTAALTAAALLRLFPIVFLGGLGVYFISEWVRARRLSKEARRALMAFAVTIGVGVTAVAVAHGPGKFGQFKDVVTAHADAPAGNRLGLPHLLSLGPGKMSSAMMDARLTDPSEPWKERVRLSVKERKPIWYFAVFASFGLLFWVVWRRRSPWLSTLAPAPLLYSLQSMTSYDYIWLVLLVPAAFGRPRALKWLCGFAIVTQVIGIAHPDVESRHWLYAFALFPTILVLAWELIHIAGHGGLGEQDEA